MKTLEKLLFHKLRWEFTYAEVKTKKKSGMTRSQEYLKKLGIKECIGKASSKQKEKYFIMPHPVPWSLSHSKKYNLEKSPNEVFLLIPKELAIKIETIGYLP